MASAQHRSLKFMLASYQKDTLFDRMKSGKLRVINAKPTKCITTTVRGRFLHFLKSNSSSEGHVLWHLRIAYDKQGEFYNEGIYENYQELVRAVKIFCEDYFETTIL